MVGEKALFECPTCPWCKQGSQIVVELTAFQAWRSGALIQDAFPNFTVDQREQMMTGYHPKCWNEIFGF